MANVLTQDLLMVVQYCVGRVRSNVFNSAIDRYFGCLKFAVYVCD